MLSLNLMVTGLAVMDSLIIVSFYDFPRSTLVGLKKVAVNKSIPSRNNSKL